MCLFCFFSTWPFFSHPYQNPFTGKYVGLSRSGCAALQVQCSSSNAIKKGCTPDFRSIVSRPSFGLGFDFAYRLETLTLQSPYSLSAQLQLVLIFGISFMTQSNAFCITLPISKRMPCISNREGTLFCPFSSKK